MSTNGPSSSPVFRRRILFTSLAGLAMAGGVGGYELHRAHRPPHKQPDGRYRKLTIAWPHATTAPVLAVAYQKDFFARYSLELETAGDFLDGSEALDALAHGKAAYAVAPALTWLPRLHAGLQASLVLGIQPGVFRLLVRRGSGVTRLDHLLNRPVGVPDLNAADKLFFAIMMRRKGINAMAGVNWKTLPAEELLGAARARSICICAVGLLVVLHFGRHKFNSIRAFSVACTVLWRSVTGNCSRIPKSSAIRIDFQLGWLFLGCGLGTHRRSRKRTHEGGDAAPVVGFLR